MRLANVVPIGLMAFALAGFGDRGRVQAEAPRGTPETRLQHPAGSAEEMQERRRRRHRMRMRCPEVPQGTSVQALDTDDGAALDFTIDEADDVADLRDAVDGMVERHNRRHAKDEDEDRRRRRRRHMVPSQAQSETIQDGARMAFTPDDADDLDALRWQVRRMADRMGRRCPWATEGEE